MRLCLPLLFLLSPPLSAEPRITQAARHTSIEGAPVFIDVDGNGHTDILFTNTGAIWGPMPHLLRNEGNRVFGQPETLFYFRGSPNYNEAGGDIVELNGPGDFHFISRSGFLAQDGQYVYIPQASPILPAGRSQDRTSIGPASPLIWTPVELDDDHISEFLTFSHRDGEDESTLTIHDRQPDGSYLPSTFTIQGSISSSEVIVADLDLDGDLDLLSYGDEGFQPIERTGEREFSSESQPAPVEGNAVVADLDGDGLPEILSQSWPGLSWSENLGNMEFSAVQRVEEVPHVSENAKLWFVETIGNENAVLHFIDTSPGSLIVTKIRFGTWEQVSRIEIDCTGIGLNPIPSGYITTRPYALRDLDGDGRLDILLVVTDLFPDSSSISRAAVAWGTDNGFESPVYLHPAPVSTRSLIAGNFDADPAPDFIAGPDVEGGYWFFANEGDGTFVQKSRVAAFDLPAGCPPGTTITSTVTADVTGDGILDLVFSYSRTIWNMTHGACVIAPGNGDGTFALPELPEGAFDTLTFRDIDIDTLVDWDGDGDPDIISGGNWRENLGGSFSPETRPLIDGAPLMDALGNPILKVFSRIGDVDGDGHPDIISLVYRREGPPPSNPYSDSRPTTIAIGFNDGHGGIEEIAEVPIQLSSFDVLGNPVVFDLQVADLNGDGRPDLCYEQFAGSDILGNPITSTQWKRNPGGAAARNPASWIALPLGTRYLPNTLDPEADFDGDGRKDWAFADGYIRPSPAGPVVSAEYDFSGGLIQPYTTTVTVADFDMDGDTDMLVSDSWNDLFLVRNTLVDERSAITRHLVAAGAPGQKAQPKADADGDGRDNETELLFGTDPLAADAPPSNPLGLHLDASGSGRTLSFRVPDYAAELSLEYEIEHSTDLAGWSPLDGPASVLSSSGGWDYLSLPVECSGPCGYFRIRGTHRTTGD